MKLCRNVIARSEATESHKVFKTWGLPRSLWSLAMTKRDCDTAYQGRGNLTFCETIKASMKYFFLFTAMLEMVSLCSCTDLTEPSHSPQAIPLYTYRVINVYPHDRNAFTQGLVFENDFLYEGTGLHEKSSLRKVELATGSVIQMKELPRKFFGEGVTIYENRIIQLTWRSHTGFVYDKESFALLQEFSYPMEGWGITHDGSHLIMSDGTSTLHFLDPHTFKEVDQITVTDANGLVSKLNELEYVKGEIYANVWPTERVAMIKPHTGQVSGWIDLSGLLRKEDYDTPMDVLNGIAYDEKDDRLFVTGKWWPTLFEIKLIRVK